MKKQKYLILLLGMVLAFNNSCDSFLEPEEDNIYEIDDVLGVMTFAEGFLINAYRNVPASHESFATAYGSDDAANNITTSSIKTVVDGGWTSVVNPFSRWNTAYESIFYINTFLMHVEDVVWDVRDPILNDAFLNKLKGEAYALRAWNYFDLLQAHAGKGTNGEMLGVPIVEGVLELNPSDYTLPRANFSELVEYILADCELAIGLLPDRWIDTDPATDVAIGERNTNRINGLVAKFIKAKTILYAASPAYAGGTNYTYQDAAVAAAEFMASNGGLDDLYSRTNFYNQSGVTRDNENNEVFWYSFKNPSQNSWERTNFAPSVFGNGLTNPSQNLVDAFPMKDGTPISESVDYDPQNPYDDRDPRLDLFIMKNGQSYKGGTLNTIDGSQDALGSMDNDASITGYYLRKFLNDKRVDLSPNVNSGGTRYYTYARYTDVLLMFAEAANEVVGPDGMIPGHDYTARNVINEIRDKAKITSTAYVDGLDQTGMRDLIRNERRVEMCFEKQRFWDLRRWNMLSEMNVPIKGVRITEDPVTSVLMYAYPEVENRSYGAHQVYGPIPFSETLKYDIIQNQGW